MKKYQKRFIWSGVFFIMALSFSIVHWIKTPTKNSPSGVYNQISYICNENKTIDADFYEGKTIEPTNPNEPPIPGGSADVKLSNGRELNLKQTISADGVRYANQDESFIFWTKGNGALVLENNQEKNYIGCIMVKADTGGLSKIYQNNAMQFSLRYPENYTLDTSYKYQAFGPGKDINGVKFTIPATMVTGTNLGSDSYISVEQIPKTEKCTADMFLQTNVENKNQGVKEITENDTTYSLATNTGAAAGNRYEETVYALPGTNPCIVVRYFIHYGVFENYPTGTIKEFDKQAILSQFYKIRNTLVIN